MTRPILQLSAPSRLPERLLWSDCTGPAFAAAVEFLYAPVGTKFCDVARVKLFTEQVEKVTNGD